MNLTFTFIVLAGLFCQSYSAWQSIFKNGLRVNRNIFLDQPYNLMTANNDLQTLSKIKVDGLGGDTQQDRKDYGMYKRWTALNQLTVDINDAILSAPAIYLKYNNVTAGETVSTKSEIATLVDAVHSLAIEARSGSFIGANTRIKKALSTVMQSVAEVTNELRSQGLDARREPPQEEIARQVLLRVTDNLLDSMTAMVYAVTEEMTLLMAQAASDDGQARPLQLSWLLECPRDTWIFAALALMATHRLWVCVGIVLTHSETCADTLKRMVLQVLLPLVALTALWCLLMQYNEPLVAALNQSQEVFVAVLVATLCGVVGVTVLLADRSSKPKVQSAPSAPSEANANAVCGVSTQHQYHPHRQQQRREQRQLSCVLQTVVVFLLFLSVAALGAMVELSAGQAALQAELGQLHYRMAEVEHSVQSRLYAQSASEQSSQASGDDDSDSTNNSSSGGGGGGESALSSAAYADLAERITFLQEQLMQSGIKRTGPSVVSNFDQTSDSSSNGGGGNSEASAALLSQLSGRINQLSNQYNLLVNTQLVAVNTELRQLASKYTFLKEEVYSLNKYIINEVSDHFQAQFDARLAALDGRFVTLLNDQMAAMDKYVIRTVNEQVATVSDHMSAHIAREVRALDESLIAQLNAQMKAMDVYVVDLVNGQVRALDAHIHRKLTDMMGQYVERVAQLEADVKEAVTAAAAAAGAGVGKQ